jgi:preprotein translocase subunit YajC
MFFATPALAQTPAGGGGAFPEALQAFALPVALFALFYFMILRPQQARMKKHQAMLAAVKKGDTVVLSSGIIGKVSKVDDAELGVDIATGVTIKVVRSMVSEVRAKGEPAPANDAKTVS